MSEILNAERVQNIVRDCLFRPDELDEHGLPKISATMVSGFTKNFNFSTHRIHLNFKIIKEMLDELPDQFKESGGGGGWSILDIGNDKHGRIWTRLRSAMEELVILGIAAGLVKFISTKWPSYEMMHETMPEPEFLVLVLDTGK